MRSLIKSAEKMEGTCHRAIDQVGDVYAAIDTLVSLGVKRILTTRQAENPYTGIETLAEKVKFVQQKLLIIAAGVSPFDVNEIIIKMCGRGTFFGVHNTSE